VEYIVTFADPKRQAVIIEARSYNWATAGYVSFADQEGESLIMYSTRHILSISKAPPKQYTVPYADPAEVSRMQAVADALTSSTRAHLKEPSLTDVLDTIDRIKEGESSTCCEESSSAPERPSVRSEYLQFPGYTGEDIRIGDRISRKMGVDPGKAYLNDPLGPSTKKPIIVEGSNPYNSKNRKEKNGG